MGKSFFICFVTKLSNYLFIFHYFVVGEQQFRSEIG